MAKLSCILLAAFLGIVVASPQRNLQYPTTRRPGPTTPSTSVAPGNPTTPAPSTSTPQTAPYAPAGFRPGRAFNLPTEEKKAEQPSGSYGPPADRYGPPEDATTTVQPEFVETANDSATAKIPKDLSPGFYFIQLPGGGIQKVALLTNAALVELPPAAAFAEETTTPTQERDVEGEDTTEPTGTATPTAEHVQPIAKTQRTVEVWPAVPVVQVKPAVVQSAKLIQPIRSQPLVAVEPIVYVQPKSFSYQSQFRTW